MIDQSLVSWVGGGGGEFLLLGLGCQESECRHSGIKSSQI